MSPNLLGDPERIPDDCNGDTDDAVERIYTKKVSGWKYWLGTASSKYSRRPDPGGKQERNALRKGLTI